MEAEQGDNPRRIRFMIDVAAPTNEAFALISDIERHGKWSPQEFEAIRVDSGPIGVGSRYRTAGRKGARRGHLRAADVDVTAYEPTTRFGFAATEPAGTYRTTFVISPAAIGSHVERIVDPPTAGVVPFIRHVMLASVVRRYVQQNMDALKERLDRGAPVA
jgi:polyketide cyclase/dehydrase/lipid transport protein